MSNKSTATVATMGIDIGKNSFHAVGLDRRGAIVLRQKWSRSQVEARLANMPLERGTVLGAIKAEPCGWPQQRPALTAPARGALHVEQAGTKERLTAQTKELVREKTMT